MTCVKLQCKILYKDTKNNIRLGTKHQKDIDFGNWIDAYILFHFITF